MLERLVCRSMLLFDVVDYGVSLAFTPFGKVNVDTEDGFAAILKVGRGWNGNTQNGF